MLASMPSSGMGNSNMRKDNRDRNDRGSMPRGGSMTGGNYNNSNKLSGRGGNYQDNDGWIQTGGNKNRGGNNSTSFDPTKFRTSAVSVKLWRFSLFTLDNKDEQKKKIITVNVCHLGHLMLISHFLYPFFPWYRN